jgi:hypothetical protein
MSHRKERYTIGQDITTTTLSLTVSYFNSLRKYSIIYRNFSLRISVPY